MASTVHGNSTAGTSETVDEETFLIKEAGLWTLAWLVIFYALSLTYSFWGRRLGKSSKAHENDRFWCARQVLGIVHAVLVSVLSLPGLWILLGAPSAAQYADSTHLAYCRIDKPQFIAYATELEAIALAGLAFTTFTLADIVICLAHCLAGVDYIVHHIAFVSAGLIIRGNCMLPMNSAILIAMEVSTPFLNYLMLFRNRGDAYKSKVVVNGCIFVATFVLFRLILNVYGTLRLILGQVGGNIMPARVPEWQQHFLLVAITAGASVQLWWAPGVLITFGSKMRDLAKKGDCSAAEDSDGASPRQDNGSLQKSLLKDGTS